MLTSKDSYDPEYFTGRSYGTNLVWNYIIHLLYLVPCPAHHLSSSLLFDNSHIYKVLLRDLCCMTGSFVLCLFPCCSLFCFLYIESCSHFRFCLFVCFLNNASAPMFIMGSNKTKSILRGSYVRYRHVEDEFTATGKGQNFRAHLSDKKQKVIIFGTKWARGESKMDCF